MVICSPCILLTGRNGIMQRRNSWQDGVFGTNCPIPPGRNFTYVLQVKDQIGSFFYFPSLAFHKAAGGYGGIKIASRSVIPVPFSPPAGDYTILAGDWFKQNHTVSVKYMNLSAVQLLNEMRSWNLKGDRFVVLTVFWIWQDLKAVLDSGHDLPFPDGILINGRGSNGYTFNVEQGNTYRFRISNVGLRLQSTSESKDISWFWLRLKELIHYKTHMIHLTFIWASLIRFWSLLTNLLKITTLWSRPGSLQRCSPLPRLCATVTQPVV